MRVSAPGEAKHASIYPHGEMSEGGCPAPFFGPTLRARRVCLFWMCYRVHGILLCETLLEFLIGVFEAMIELENRNVFLAKIMIWSLGHK